MGLERQACVGRGREGDASLSVVCDRRSMQFNYWHIGRGGSRGNLRRGVGNVETGHSGPAHATAYSVLQRVLLLLMNRGPAIVKRGRPRALPYATRTASHPNNFHAVAHPPKARYRVMDGQSHATTHLRTICVCGDTHARL